MVLRQIGRNVRTARLRHHLTQECLAELVGIHWKTLGYIERGKCPFAVTTFALISQHLAIDPAELLFGLPPIDVKRAERIRKALTRRRRAPSST